MHNKRVMVVGGTGKIGKHLVRKLVEMGNEVHAIARFSNPDQLQALKNLGIKTYKRDVAQPDAFKGVPADFDCVFHEAALKFGSEGNPDYTIEMNIRAVGRAIEHFADVKAFLFASSGNVYPDSKDGLTERDAPLPPSLYAITRLGGEWMVDYFSRRNGTPAVIHRIFYGYHEEFGVPTDIARQIRDGEAIDLTTSYVNVIWLDDLMEKMIASYKVAAVPPRVLNLTGLKRVPVRLIAEKLGKLMGKKPKFKGTPKPAALLGKADEMARLLGKPKVSLDEGLRRIARSVMVREFPLDHPTQWEKRKGFGVTH
jgi:nucleoside-diphosphate-sugar epimerase